MTSDQERLQRLTELQSCLGKALWQIQAFEDTLAHLIAVVLKMPARTSLKEAETILENVQRNTLGDLFKETKKVIHFDESFDVFMKKFLDERNWLVHRSWRSYHGLLYKQNEYKSLLIRVRRLSDDALEYNKLFSGFLEEWVQERGVTKAELDQLQKQFLDVWQEET